MPTWEARVTRGTAPADRVDAELRYAYAAPLLRDAALWVDLGCGTGSPPAPPARRRRAPRALSWSTHEADALAEARREVGVEVVAAVEADLVDGRGR